jgi:serine/threonine protein kinase
MGAKFQAVPDNQQSIEIDIATTGAEQKCSECGLVGCGHRTTTNDVTGSAGERKRKRASAEMPPEMAEFAANYVVEGLIGEGGMSAVYKAQHKALNKPMAIKMLHAHLVRDVVQRKRFEQEAQALFLLEHPNIVKLRDFGSTSTAKPYLIMDFLKGKSLSDVIKAEKTIGVHRSLKIFQQVCDALEHAHSKNIVHRDIKPSNIVLVQDDAGEESVRIVDFGIAKFKEDEINPGLTQTGDVFGSPLYMSPEQCLGHKLDQRSDVYAFGCVMYEMLSGHPPLVGETALSTIHKHTSEVPQPLQVPDCDAKLRARLDEIIFKTLEKDPDKRYQSMAALRADLHELQADTKYRKGTGYYVKYARVQRRAINTIRQNPLRFIAGFAIVAALSSWVVYLAADVGKDLIQPPEPLNTSLDWNWSMLPTKAIPIDFLDKLRVARFLVLNKANRLGSQDELVRDMRKKLAMEVIKFGFWDEAIEHLEEARAGYEEYDPRLADINQLIGDCYVQKRDFEKAAKAFHNALEGYQKHSTTADNSVHVTRIKLGQAYVRANKLSLADTQFKAVQEDLRGKHDQAYALEHALADIGSADTTLALVQAGTTDDQQRKYMLEDARGMFGIASNRQSAWSELSKHDGVLCLIRMGDANILLGNLKEAEQNYKEALKTPGVFNDTELAQIQRNYARLLLRTGDVLAAMQMESLATSTAKRALEHVSTQNIVHGIETMKTRY